jgi:hypothetical protein
MGTMVAIERGAARKRTSDLRVYALDQDEHRPLLLALTRRARNVPRMSSSAKADDPVIAAFLRGTALASIAAHGLLDAPPSRA